MKTIVVIPALNEEENIAPLLEGIFLSEKPGLDVLVINDHSTDATREILEEYSQRHANLFIADQPQAQQGLALCYRFGFLYALEHGYDWIVTMDADLSHDPRDIGSLMRQVSDGVDWIVGSRYVPGGSSPGLGLVRSLVSFFGNLYVRRRLQLTVQDVTSGFNCIRADLLRCFDFDRMESRGFAFQVELKALAALQGAVFKEVPIVFQKRHKGVSKFRAAMITEALARIEALSQRSRRDPVLAFKTGQQPL